LNVCAKRSFREVFDTNGSDPFTPRYAIFVSDLTTQSCDSTRFDGQMIKKESTYFELLFIPESCIN